MKDIDFGRRLQQKRKQLNLTSEQVADICCINIGYFRQIESGYVPGLPLLKKFCDILKTTPNYLLGFSDDVRDDQDQELVRKIFTLEKEQQEITSFLLKNYINFRKHRGYNG